MHIRLRRPGVLDRPVKVVRSSPAHQGGVAQGAKRLSGFSRGPGGWLPWGSRSPPGPRLFPRQQLGGLQMKTIKSLVLGSAAGLLAVGGAQAADLPVKAKAVEYVRICSLYGGGFYYIPGTDTCIKIGGYLRAEAAINANSDSGGNFNGAGGANNRFTNAFTWRGRSALRADLVRSASNTPTCSSRASRSVGPPRSLARPGRAIRPTTWTCSSVAPMTWLVSASSPTPLSSAMASVLRSRFRIRLPTFRPV